MRICFQGTQTDLRWNSERRKRLKRLRELGRYQNEADVGARLNSIDGRFTKSRRTSGSHHIRHRRMSTMSRCRSRSSRSHFKRRRRKRFKERSLLSKENTKRFIERNTQPGCKSTLDTNVSPSRNSHSRKALQIQIKEYIIVFHYFISKKKVRSINTINNNHTSRDNFCFFLGQWF